MTPEEREIQQVKAQQALHKASMYADLELDERFMLWRSDQIDTTLRKMTSDVMDSKPYTIIEGTPVYDPYWKDKLAAGVLAYQDFKKAHIDSFKIMSHAQKKAKEKIEELKEKK